MIQMQSGGLVTLLPLQSGILGIPFGANELRALRHGAEVRGILAANRRSPAWVKAPARPSAKPTAAGGGQRRRRPGRAPEILAVKRGMSAQQIKDSYNALAEFGSAAQALADGDDTGILLGGREIDVRRGCPSAGSLPGALCRAAEKLRAGQPVLARAYGLTVTFKPAMNYPLDSTEIFTAGGTPLSDGDFEDGLGAARRGRAAAPSARRGRAAAPVGRRGRAAAPAGRRGRRDERAGEVVTTKAGVTVPVIGPTAAEKAAAAEKAVVAERAAAEKAAADERAAFVAEKVAFAAEKAAAAGRAQVARGEPLPGGSSWPPEAPLPGGPSWPQRPGWLPSGQRPMGPRPAVPGAVAVPPPPLGPGAVAVPPPPPGPGAPPPRPVMLAPATAAAFAARMFPGSAPAGGGVARMGGTTGYTMEFGDSSPFADAALMGAFLGDSLGAARTKRGAKPTKRGRRGAAEPVGRRGRRAAGRPGEVVTTAPGVTVPVVGPTVPGAPTVPSGRMGRRGGALAAKLAAMGLGPGGAVVVPPPPPAVAAAAAAVAAGIVPPPQTVSMPLSQQCPPGYKRAFVAGKFACSLVDVAAARASAATVAAAGGALPGAGVPSGPPAPPPPRAPPLPKKSPTCLAPYALDAAANKCVREAAQPERVSGCALSCDQPGEVEWPSPGGCAWPVNRKCVTCPSGSRWDGKGNCTYTSQSVTMAVSAEDKEAYETAKADYDAQMLARQPPAVRGDLFRPGVGPAGGDITKGCPPGLIVGPDGSTCIPAPAAAPPGGGGGGGIPGGGGGGEPYAPPPSRAELPEEEEEEEDEEAMEGPNSVGIY